MPKPTIVKYFEDLHGNSTTIQPIYSWGMLWRRNIIAIFGRETDDKNRWEDYGGENKAKKSVGVLKCFQFWSWPYFLIRTMRTSISRLIDLADQGGEIKMVPKPPKNSPPARVAKTIVNTLFGIFEVPCYFLAKLGDLVTGGVKLRKDKKKPEAIELKKQSETTPLLQTKESTLTENLAAKPLADSKYFLEMANSRIDKLQKHSLSADKDNIHKTLNLIANLNSTFDDLNEHLSGGILVLGPKLQEANKLVEQQISILIERHKEMTLEESTRLYALIEESHLGKTKASLLKDAKKMGFKKSKSSTLGIATGLASVRAILTASKDEVPKESKDFDPIAAKGLIQQAKEHLKLAEGVDKKDDVAQKRLLQDYTVIKNICDAALKAKNSDIHKQAYDLLQKIEPHLPKNLEKKKISNPKLG